MKSMFKCEEFNEKTNDYFKDFPVRDKSLHILGWSQDLHFLNFFLLSFK